MTAIAPRRSPWMVRRVLPWVMVRGGTTEATWGPPYEKNSTIA